MEAVCDATALIDAVTAARKVVPAAHESRLAAYTSVLIRAQPDRLEVLATDGHTSIGVQLPATVLVVGQLLVPSGPLVRWLEGRDGHALELSKSGSDTLLADTTVKQQGVFYPPAVSFPSPHEADIDPFEIDGTGLAGAIRAVRTSVGVSGVIQVRSTDTHLQLLATDNHRLTCATLLGAGFGTFEGLVPADGIELLAYHQIDAVLPDKEQGNIRFSGPASLVELPLLDRPFPVEAGALIDQQPPIQVNIPVRELTVALDQLAAFAGADDDPVPVRGKLHGDTLQLQVDNPEAGRASATVTTDPDGREDSDLPVPFAVAWPFLADAVKLHATDVVNLGLHEDLSPLLLRSTDESGSSIVVALSQVLL